MKNEPTYNLLNALNTPEDLRRLTPEQLPEVCDELRQDIIKEVSCRQSGGGGAHGGSALCIQYTL